MPFKGVQVAVRAIKEHRSVAYRNVCSILLSRRIQLREHVGVEHVIRVDKHDVFASRTAEPGVSGRTTPRICLKVGFHPVIALGKTLNQRPCAIGATVVNDDELEAVEVLVQYALNRFADMALFIVCNEDD